MAHSPEKKAQVIAALLAGQGVNEIARDLDLPKSVVSRWRSELPETKTEQIGTQKTRDFGEMVGNYLESLLDTAIKQQDVFRDPLWLRDQNAADLAVLHGVLVDKGIRLFEAAARAHAPAADGPALSSNASGSSA